MFAKDLREHLNKDQKTLLSNIRTYVISIMDHESLRHEILRSRTMDKAEKRERLLALDEKIDFVSFHLFLSEMYHKFVYGDKVIKETVSIFESLEVEGVQIGNTRFARDEEIYDRGVRLAEALMGTIAD